MVVTISDIQCNGTPFVTWYFRQYALRSLIEYNGLSAEEALVEVQPREGEETLRTEDVLRVIEEEGDSVAVVCMAGVQYYTGETMNRARLKGCPQVA